MRFLRFKFSILVFYCYLAQLNCHGDDQLDKLKGIYQSEVGKISDQYISDLSQVQAVYLTNLDKALKSATEKGDLEGYKKIDEEKKRFEAEKTMPTDSSVQPLLEKAEQKKNSAILVLSKKYVAGLNARKIALMREKDIAGASAVQDEIKRVESECGTLKTTTIPDPPKKALAFPKPAPTKQNIALKDVAELLGLTAAGLKVGNEHIEGYVGSQGSSVVTFQAKETFSFTDYFEFGYTIKSKQYQSIHALIDGERYGFSIGHWHNSGHLVWHPTAGEGHKPGGLTVVAPDKWHDLKMVVKGNSIMFYYDKKLLAEKSMDGYKNGDERKISVGFVAYMTPVELKDFYKMTKAE